MLRLLTLLFLLFFNLYANNDAFAICIQKAKDANIVQENSLSIPVQYNRRIVFTQKKPKAKILKADPFLSLYLVQDKHPFRYPYDVAMRLQPATAILNEKRAKEGKMIQHQRGLDSFARYNQKLPLPAIISSSCCSLEGIASSKGVIEKEYLQHFLKTKRALYGDIGIRVHDEKGLVVVDASDPFMKLNPFKVNDCILMFDHKKVKNSASLMRKILFSPIGSKHRLKVKRGAKFFTYSVTCKQRYGGGFLSDTFLEQKGIYFDDGLHVSSLNKQFQGYGLKIGDKLIGVNGVSVTNQNELRRYIENFKDYSSLLFERNNFEFFVNIK